MEHKTLAEMMDRNVEIVFADAVAIAQQLICEPDVLAGAEAPYGPLTLQSVAVTAEGTVRCLHTAATPTVVEVGLLLHDLLRSSQRVPGRLRYTVGRALHEVEAPPFESTREFSTALERFELCERREQLASLFERARAASALDAGVLTLSAPKPIVSGHPERRTHQQSAAELRRHLRDADLRLYEAQRLSTPGDHPVRKSRLRRAPIAACMVAGVTLVAAGEIAHLGQQAPTPGASQPPSFQIAPNIPSATEPQPAVTTAPVQARAVSPGPTVKSTGARRTDAKALAQTTGNRTPTRAGAASRSTKTSSSSARKGADPRPAREREKSDRGLRIRFVWNNPFR